MKGKTSIKIRIPTVRRNPNASKKIQKWRYYFESFAKIDKKHDDFHANCIVSSICIALFTLKYTLCKLWLELNPENS